MKIQEIAKQISSGELSLHSESDSFFLIDNSNSKRLPLTSKQFHDLLRKTKSFMIDESLIREKAQQLGKTLKQQLNEFEAQEDVTVRDIFFSQDKDELGILYAHKNKK